MKLSQSQLKVIELLSDKKWHNQYNNGIKGLKYQTLHTLIKKGIVIKKTEINQNRNKNKFGNFEFHSERDILYKLK